MQINSFLNQDLEWALNVEAKECLHELVALGIDPDLALSVMQELLPDTQLYALEDDDNE